MFLFVARWLKMGLKKTRPMALAWGGFKKPIPRNCAKFWGKRSSRTICNWKQSKIFQNVNPEAKSVFHCVQTLMHKKKLNNRVFVSFHFFLLGNMFSPGHPLSSRLWCPCFFFLFLKLCGQLQQFESPDSSKVFQTNGRKDRPEWNRNIASYRRRAMCFSTRDFFSFSKTIREMIGNTKKGSRNTKQSKTPEIIKTNKCVKQSTCDLSAPRNIRPHQKCFIWKCLRSSTKYMQRACNEREYQPGRIQWRQKENDVMT